MKTSLPKHIRFILSTYIIGIGIFFLFRLSFIFTEWDKVNALPSNQLFNLISQSFIMGFRFDTVISGYILFFPFILLSLLMFNKNNPTKIYRFIFWMVFILYAISFIICAIDVPFFHQFYNRLNISALQWTETPGFVFKMIFQEFRYWCMLLPLTAIIIFHYYLLNKLFTKHLINTTNFKLTPLKAGGYIFYSLICLCLLFIGIRGRLDHKSPIRVGTANFSNYSLPNQMGLNPIFTFSRSFIDYLKEENQPLQLMDNQKALEQVQQAFDITNELPQSPIARNITPKIKNTNKKNVVLIIMEGMSAAKMTRYGNKANLTPFLDSLSEKSLCFNQIYTAGIHTFNGVFSTLFSFPAIYNKHPMKQVPTPRYDGIASTLKQHNYNTCYFTTHDDQFDNIGGFLKENSFDEIIAQKNYPADKIKSVLGVSDDYLFEYGIKHLNKLAQKQQPFLSVFMTASDHGPYIIPEYFKPKSKDIKQQAVEYADWSLRKFIQMASKESWFDNTLFVLVADHGAAINPNYDMPLNYHHTPLLIYAPAYIQPKSIDNIGGQIDVFPTIMGLLQLPYTNNTMGIDLLNESRPYIYFCADDKCGVLNNQYFLIIKKDGSKSLYNHKKQSNQNELPAKTQQAKEMENYLRANMQTADYFNRKFTTTSNR